MPIKRLKKRLDKQYRAWLIAALLLLGAISLIVRILLSTGEGVPASDKVYILSYEASFKATDTRAIIKLAPPWDTANALVIAQKIQNTGLRLLRNRSNKESTRDITAVATSVGQKELSAEFTIHVSPLGHKRVATQTTLTPQQRQRYLSNSTGIEVDSSEVINVIAKLSANHLGKDQLIDQIFRYASKNINLVNKVYDDDANTVLRTHKANNLGRARAMVALCRASKIPARLIAGFVLKEGFDIEQYYWVETYHETKWVSYDPENGYSGQLPPNFIPVRRGGNSVIGESSVTDINLNIDISEQYVPVGKLGREVAGVTDILDLSRLSLDARTTLAILLLLPLGTLLTTFCRNVIGIRTYGTFTPSLLALAARYADWITAMVILLIVAATGILGRAFLPDKLSRVPRLTIVFTIVAMSMTLSVSIMDYFAFNPAGHIVLLPIIILTSLIDSLYKTLDEDGIRIAIIRLGWTAIVAVGCYFILIQEQLGYFILAYPEIHIFTIMIVLLLSAYKYRKLSGFSFFKWLGEPTKPKPNQPNQDTDNKTITITEKTKSQP